MNDWQSPVTRPLARRPALALAALLVTLCLGHSARADVFGRLRVVVQDPAGKPVQSAVVTFHDPTGVRGDVRALSDAQGVALSPPLENHAWQVGTQVVTFQTDTRQVTVASDTTTEIDVSLTRSVLQGSRTVILGNRNPTASSTQRSQSFILKFPATGADPQSLPRLLATNPGFVQSSVNSVHPRGEHASTTIYINGFQLPGVLQGRAGPQIDPDIIQNADIQTGGYAPEYGSETAAILNLNLREGTIKPFENFSVDGGGYDTLDQELTLGGQGGAPLHAGDAGGDVPRRFRYLINASNRSTDNTLEPPQPDDQSAHNHGTAATLFGNFEYLPSSRDQFTLLVNSAPASTQIANRTGLPSKYAPVGQGFGYGGARNADGSEAGITPDPAVLGSQDIALGSQQADGQDVYQKDANDFAALNYRHTFNPRLTGLVSAGVNRSILDIFNHNPSIDLNSLNPDGTLMTIDNSIEYNPTILRSSTQKELSASLTQVSATHTYKAGFLLTGQTGDELYQFTPQSQLALDALNAVQAGGPQLTPNGTAQMDAQGNPVLDTLGNQVYLITPGATTPVVRVHRSGYYNAGYVQDTWRESRRFTANYGLRLDGYGQKQNLGTPSVNQAFLSPRVNLAYSLGGGATALASYDKLFTQPPLAQGAIVGTSLKPQITNAYEVDLQKQFGRYQTAKIAEYQKNDHNQNDTGILIPYTQIGAYTTLQYTDATIRGTEFSYELTPQGGVGMGGYVPTPTASRAPAASTRPAPPRPTSTTTISSTRSAPAWTTRSSRRRSRA